MRALGLALMLCLAGCKRSDPPTRLQNARERLYAHQPQAALEEYRLALDALDRDESKEAAVYRARALRGAADTYYLELRDFKRAVEVYRELSQLCPEAPETLEGRLHLADILEHQFHDLRGAIAELTAALARNPPQSAELSYRVAKLYFELGDYQQCELESAKVVSKFETSPYVDDALLLRGQALGMMEGHRAEALRAFESLAEKFADSELQPHALFEAGKLRAEGGEPEKAIETWVEALKRHPDPQIVQAVIGRVRKQLRQTTPSKVGDAAKAFDRDVPGANPVRTAAKMPKTSIEAVGGSADEAAREAKMGGDARGAPGPVPREEPAAPQAPAP
jgi:tetratricopeptide (TPR) repeat protein